MKVVAVVSVYNEEERILPTLQSLESIEAIDQIVVVDDASTDNTGRLLHETDVRVIVNGRNLGKGDSLNLVVPSLKYDVILLVDGDLGDSAVEARKLLLPVLGGDVDMSIAAFPPPDVKGGFGLVLGLARWGIKALTEREMSSPLSGQRAIRKEVIEGVGGFDRKFGVEVGLTIDAIRKGFRVVEVPTDMTHRETGRDFKDFLHRGRQFADVCLTLARRCLNSRRISR